MECDFCSQPNPEFMFANPFIECSQLKLVYRAGHFAACRDCAELLESGSLQKLAQRALRFFAMAEPIDKEHAVIIEAELLRVYQEISRIREPIETPEVYARRHIA